MTASPEPLPTKQMSRVERAMFASVPLWSVLLLVLAGFLLLLFFGFLVLRGAEKKTGRSALERIALSIADVPMTLRQALSPSNPFAAPGGDVEPLPAGFWRNSGQTFVDPGYMLISRYSAEEHRSVIEIVRLSDGKVVHRYLPDIAGINRQTTVKSPFLDIARDKGVARYQPFHPLLVADGGLVFNGASAPLVRVDACGKTKWVTNGIFSHSLEPSVDGGFWSPLTLAKSKRRGGSDRFREDAIVHVGDDGKILSSVSFLDILERNGLSHLWEGRPYHDDPAHLNDIEPVRESGPYWQRGDLLISSRFMGVMLYRPSTGKILWHREGPWSHQHDINIVDDHRVSVFDNNNVASAVRDFVPDGETNQVLVHDFTDNSVTTPFAAGFARNQIKTVTEGRGQILSNGDVVVEETNYGRVVRMAPDGTIRWRYISADGNKKRFRLAWSRYLDPTNSGGAVKAAVNAKCS